MKDLLKKIFLVLTLVIIVFSLQSSSAFAILGEGRDFSTYNTLEPLPTGQPGLGDGTEVNPSSYLTIVYFWALGAVIFLSVLMLVWAGVEYTAIGFSEAVVASAKKKIMAAILGLIIAFTSWLLLRVINPDLVTPGLTNSSGFTLVDSGTDSDDEDDPPRERWYYIREDSDIWRLSPSSSSQDICEANKPAGSSRACSQGGLVYLHDVIAARLASSQVRISSSGNCGDPRNPSCTSVAQLPEIAIANLQSLRATCNCEVRITGGTETGHQTHGPGQPIVDLRHGTEANSLSNFLLNQSSDNDDIGDLSCGEAIGYAGYLYIWEPAGCRGSNAVHWHVTPGSL